MSILRKYVRPVRRWLSELRIPKILTLDYYWSILSGSFSWLAGKFKNRHSRDLVLGLPGLFGAITLAVLIGMAQVQERSLSEAYYDEAELALKSKDYPRAQLLLSRVLRRGDLKVSDAQYLMAVLLEETGQTDRATQLYNVLAPDDGYGNRAAHKRMAILLSESLNADSSAENLERLYWHLTASRDNLSPVMKMAWGRYYLAIHDRKSAKQYFVEAAPDFPRLLLPLLGELERQEGNLKAAVGFYKQWLDYLSGKLDDDPKDEQTRIACADALRQLGDLETQQGNLLAGANYYELSSEHFARVLQDNPRNEQARIVYADLLVQRGNLDGARVTLEQGEGLDPDGLCSAYLAKLAVYYHDLRGREGRPMSELLGYLDRALRHDPNNEAALHRLMAHASASVEDNGELREVLAGVIADVDQPALAHLAMGNLCWLENDRQGAKSHFEVALAIRNDLAGVLNNLAWMVAHDDEPDYERAMALVNAALEKQPDNPSFLDTRGTIYFLRKEWKLALEDLEKSKSGVRDKRKVHEKLAVIYEELGMKDIAEQHRKLSEDLMSPI